MKRMEQWKKQDISRRTYCVLVSLVFAVKFGLTRFQMFYTWIDGAPLDDELMFRSAQAITAGQWLGAYDYLTLSKSMFYGVWLALVHLVHLPALGAGQLLWCAAALACAQAFAPVLKQYKVRFIVFFVLAFNPAAMASFNLRIYRDSIFPALCMLFFAGLSGYALRCTGSLKQAAGWQLLTGVGLCTAWLTREDGFWLLPFAAAGSGILIFAVLRRRELRGKPLRLALLAVPFAILAGGILTVCSLNQSYYGVFVTSDFSSGSFADAIGAMTRVEETEFTPLVTIPKEVREEIYAATDAMDDLEYWLEDDDQMQNDFVNPQLGDYQAGSFYWAIRRAAQFEGVYDSAPKAEAYWAKVAEEINAACDDGTLPSEGGRRSGTTPAVRSEYILPVIEEGLHSLWFCATFQDCEPYYSDLRSIGLPEDLAVWEDYLNEKCNAAAQAGTDLPYYSPLQKLVYGALELVRLVYALLTPLALALAAVLQVCKATQLVRNGGLLRQGNDVLCWWLLLGLLAMAVLRSFIIAFVEVASFNIGTYVMYLATVHPLLLLFAAVGIYTGWEARPWQK